MPDDLEVPAHAAAVVFDQNGVSLLLPGWMDDGFEGDLPRYILAATEVAMRYATAEAIEELASAFERRSRS